MNIAMQVVVALFALGVAAPSGCSTKREQKESVSPSQGTEEGERVVVPSDPKATYYILKREGTPKRPIVTTKRVGPSGTSFAKRESDCAKRTWRYLADGDTLADLDSAKPDEKMGPLVEGSIADVMWHHACDAH
jgi:hypothetical protein